MLIRMMTLGALALFAQPGPPSLARMRKDLDYLASNQLAGRLSLTPQADTAAHYIADEFRKAGLAPPYLQEFPLVAFDPDRARTHLTLKREGAETALAEGSDFRGGFWREVHITARVVSAGYGVTAPEYKYDDYAAIDAHGAAILILDHDPPSFNSAGYTRYANSRAKMENALRHGAVMVLLVSAPPPRGNNNGTPLRGAAPRQALVDDAIPVLQVSDHAAEELRRPGVSIDFAAAPAHVRRGKSLNAVGLLEGSDPALRGETVMLTAHYDHLGVLQGRVYPGANDNASGAVAVMELARMFASASERPRRSLLFVVFGSEEEGLLGSYYYVAHPLRPLATTRAVINLDMIARDEAHIPQSEGVVEIPADTHNEINLIGSSYSPGLRAAIERANEQVHLEISTKFDRDRAMNALFRCDHYPFLLHNVPAVWIFGGWHPGYHEPSDTVEKLNFSKLEKVVRLAYVAAGQATKNDDLPHE